MSVPSLRWLASFVLLAFSGVSPAAAQPLGMFSWQMQPYCNRVTLDVTQNGALFTLDGADDQCGATTRGSATGTAFPNPNGTVGLGFSIVATPGGNPTHVDATIDLASASGTWRDSAGNTGTFVFNGAAAGAPRPVHARTGPLEIQAGQFTLPELQITGVGLTPNFLSVRTGGTPALPAAVLNGDQLLNIEAAGHNGSAISNPRARIRMAANENWTAGANGTAMGFWTTSNGSTVAQTRMTIAANGNVGIGTITPADRLDVNGDIRVGTGVTGCVLDSDGTLLIGTCSSDARFKRDISAFEPVLSKVSRLRPVHFYWRAAEFPEKSFGDRVSYGLVAQEVEGILPDLVATDADGYKAVNYSKLPLLAIQAIKELEAENGRLRHDIAALERRLRALEASIALHPTASNP